MPLRMLAAALVHAALLAVALTFVACGTTTSTTQAATATSIAVGVATLQGTAVVEQLGNAAISYLSGKLDLASVQRLVGPSAQADLTQMLSSLHHPTRCKVVGVFQAAGSSDEVGVDLLFGGDDKPAEFRVTISVDTEARTVKAITAIRPRSA